MKKDKKYQRLLSEIRREVARTVKSSSFESEKPRIKQVFVSNGYDLEDFDDFLRDVVSEIASTVSK